jgi:Rrf2 family transcriptional regulator, cysteine metabolism repressor
MEIGEKAKELTRVIIDFALHSKNKKSVSLQEIKDRQKIPIESIRKLFFILEKYRYVQQAEDDRYIIEEKLFYSNIGEILKLIGTKIYLTNEEKNVPLTENGIEFCLEKLLWARILEVISSVIDSVTIEDLIESHESMDYELIPMYFI